MAPATTANGKPKRKRQRRRRQQQSDSSSDSSSSSSSSDSESSSDDEAPTKPAPLPSSKASDDSSDDSSSSSDSSSSESDLSDFEMRGPGRRRGRGKKGKAAAQQQEGGQQGQTNGAATGTAAPELRRPYPSRSPSPQRVDPLHVPLGTSLFPLLKPQTEGQPILQGQVPGDQGYKAREEQDEKQSSEVAADKLQREQEREQRFGEWWRARLVSEFEGDLGGLAAEPGLNPSRLELLLSSLTTLSSLHTTSSTAAAESRSIWLHDPSAPIDPLSAVVATGDNEGAEEWGKTPVGGQGDVEVGEEGVEMDEKRSKKGKSRRKSKGKKEDETAAMEVDE